MPTLHNASHYRARALEARDMAALTKHSEMRAIFLYIAESYEELARLHDGFEWPHQNSQ